MKNLIALVAVAFGAYILVSNNAAGMTPETALKGLGGVGGGLGFLVINNFNLAKAFVLSKLNRSAVVTPVVVPSPVSPDKAVAPSPAKVVVDKQPAYNVEGMYPPKDFELYDNVSLIHIRNRLVKAGNKDGVDLCTKLATIMFTLDAQVSADVPEETKEEVVPDVKTKVSV